MSYTRSGSSLVGVTVLLWAAAACSSKDAGTTSSGAGAHGGAATTSTSSGGGASTVSTTTSTSTSSGAGGTSTTSTTSTTSSGAGGSAPTSSVWVMGYYTSWDDPANGGDYAVSSIDWDGLTHVATAFYLPDGNGTWASGTFDAATASSLIAAAHGKGKKVLASIGGAGSGPMFEASTAAGTMGTFVASLEALLAMGYDGIDIDWEGGNLSTQQDQAFETSLIHALRSDAPSALLTLTAGYENENLLDDLTWYGTIAAELDRINLMTYGMSGAWEGWESWHSAPLHWNMNSATPVGIDASVGHYLAAHVPPGKLGVGTGFYGECYTAPVTAPAQMLGASQVVASDNTMSYRNIMASYYTASAYHYDAAAMVPYLTLSGSNAEGCTFVSYEDPTSIAAKGAWVKAEGLGGTILWAISEGYVASGATVEEQNPLLEAMKTAFLP